MRMERRLSPATAGFLAMILGTLTAAQTLVTTKGPYVWTEPCTSGQIEITVRVYKDVPGSPGLYQWDYEINNLSFSPKSSIGPAWEILPA